MILCRFCEKLWREKKKKKRESLTLETKTELHSVPVPTAAMNQIGFDIWKLPEVSGDCWLDVYIDYFNKWWKRKNFSKGSEAKPRREKRQ